MSPLTALQARHRRIHALLAFLLGLVAACDKLPDPHAGEADLDLVDLDLVETLSDGDGVADEDLSPTEPCVALRAADATPVVAHVGGWVVAVGPGTGAWSVAAPHAPDVAVLSGPGICAATSRGSEAGVAVGHGQPSVDTYFGAFKVRLDRGTTWLAPADTAPTIVATPAEVRVRWTLVPEASAESALVLVFRPEGQEDLRLALETHDARWQGGAVSFACGPSDAFFGLGTQAVGMDLRGGRYPLFTQEQGIGKPDGAPLFPLQNEPEAAYAPMGVWHSTAGYTALLGGDSVAELDVCERISDRVRLRTWGELPSVVLVAGASLRDRLQGATARYLGRPQPVAPWVFAPWNDAVGGPARLAEVAALLRAEGIPSSAIWSEDWIGGAEVPDFGFVLSYAWEWDPAAYPELPSDIARLHAQGFAFLAYFNPFVPQPTRMWQEGVDGGYLVRDGTGAPYTFKDPGLRDASLVDLTHPGAVAWLSGYLAQAADLGVDGWMADFAEWLPLDAHLASGEDPWQAHNRYPLAWQRANLIALATAHASPSTSGEAADNWTFFVRSGWASVNGGTGGIAPAMWAGDQNTDWGYDDGMPTVVPIGAHVGLSGVAVYGSDIAGFTAAVTPPTTKELFLRWASLGAFTPLMRTHHGSDECLNWAFDRDPETLAHYRRYAQVHTLLYPTWRRLMAEAVDTGLPILRHPALVEPTRAGLWRGEDYEFFVGDDLLVAPVLVEGATARVVQLPGAGWWPLFADAPVVAGEANAADGTFDVTAQAPVTELPVFVRPGTVLVTLAESVDSFYGASNPGVTSLADVAGRYGVALYPAADGALRPTPVDDVATISGEGWTSAMSLETEEVRLDGSVLPPCAVTTGASCRAAGGVLHLVGSGDHVVTAGGATLHLNRAAGLTLTLAVGGRLWAGLREPTEVTELAPDIAPPCLAEP